MLVQLVDGRLLVAASSVNDGILMMGGEMLSVGGVVLVLSAMASLVSGGRTDGGMLLPCGITGFVKSPAVLIFMIRPSDSKGRFQGVGGALLDLGMSSFVGMSTWGSVSGCLRAI